MIPNELIDLICRKLNDNILEKLCLSSIFLYSLNKILLEKIDRKRKIESWIEEGIDDLIMDNDIEGAKYMISYNHHDSDDIDFYLDSACYFGDLEMVKYFVSLGGNPKAHKNASIINACTVGKLDIVKYLVSLGADITDEENKALTRACRHGHLDIVKYIYSQADIIANRNWALKIARVCDHEKIVEFLLLENMRLRKRGIN